MPANIDIVNSALLSLGQDKISSLETDQSDAGSVARTKWPEVRNAVLRNGRWRCLTKRAQLARKAAAPAFGYRYSYALPPYCFRILTFKGANPSFSAFDLADPQFLPPPSEEPKWEREGNSIVTDQEAAYITYVEYDTAQDVIGLFDSSLVAVLTALLAEKMAPSLKSAARVPALHNDYLTALREAKDNNVWEASSPETANPTALLDCR